VRGWRRQLGLCSGGACGVRCEVAGTGSKAKHLVGMKGLPGGVWLYLLFSPGHIKRLTFKYEYEI
jgi:hypothetical protein